MHYKEIQQKSLQELKSMLKDLRMQLEKLRFDLANNTLKDTSNIKKTKRDMARVLHTLNQKNKSL